MLEPVLGPPKTKVFRNLKKMGVFRKKNMDLSKWQKSTPPYDYSYKLDSHKLQELVRQYFIDGKPIKLIHVYEVILETNKILSRNPKKTPNLLNESTKNDCISNTITTNEDFKRTTLELGNNPAEESSSILNSIMKDKNSNIVSNISSSSIIIPTEKQNSQTELTELAKKCKHYPMRFDDSILTLTQKQAIVTCINVIFESNVDLDPLLRKLIAIDPQHFAFNVLFPKRKRKQKWTFDFSSSGWPFIRYPTNK